tara:strand:+ start:21 stop:272 length:252 start_codon:yes stop_codon:yes gene_type:complete
MKLNTAFEMFIGLLLVLFIQSYFFPMNYNLINEYTTRGENIETKLDLLNVLLLTLQKTFIISLSVYIIGLLLGISKKNINNVR